MRSFPSLRINDGLLIRVLHDGPDLHPQCLAYWAKNSELFMQDKRSRGQSLSSGIPASAAPQKMCVRELSGVQVEKVALERIVASLDQNSPARAVPLNEEEHALVKGLQLLTMKPMIYAANVSEGDLADSGASNAYVKALREKAATDNCEVIIVSAQVRHDLLPQKGATSRPAYCSSSG